MSIQIGDRVTWQQREVSWFGGVFLPAQILTGIVRELRHANVFSPPLNLVGQRDSAAKNVCSGICDYAFVVTGTQQLYMPSVEELTKVEEPS